MMLGFVLGIAAVPAYRIFQYPEFAVFGFIQDRFVPFVRRGIR